MVTKGKPGENHRGRLLEGMARAVAARGYGATTIADIVREASVSRRTFYEHFNSKGQCLMSLYEASSHNALKVLREAIDPTHEWRAQVETAFTAYLACMAQNPVLLRTLFIEILGLGYEGLASRRRVHREIEDFLLSVVNGDGTRGGASVNRATATAVVGGITELVLEYIEQDRAEALLELVEPASRLVRAVTAAA